MAVFGKYKIDFNIGLKRLKDVTKESPAEVREKLVMRQLYREAPDVKKFNNAILSAESVHNPNRTELARIYRSAHMDGHLTGVLANFRTAITSASFVLKGKDGEVDEEATKLTEKKYWRQLINAFATGVIDGASVLDLGDVEDDEFGDAYEIPLQYLVPERGVVKRDLGDYEGVNILEDPYWTWNVPYFEPYYLGLMEKVAPLVILKRLAMASWNEFGEIFGVPFRTGKTSITDPKRKQNMIEMLETMGVAGYAVLDIADEIDFIQAQRTDAYQVFDKMIERINSEISKAILGQTGTTDEKSFVGSAEVHESVGARIAESYKSDCEDWINLEVLPRLIKIGVFKEGITFAFEIPPKPKEAMNGAQVQAMQSLALSVQLGELEPDAAKEIMKIGYNLDDADAEAVTGKLVYGGSKAPDPASVTARMRASMKHKH